MDLVNTQQLFARQGNCYPGESRVGDYTNEYTGYWRCGLRGINPGASAPGRRTPGPGAGLSSSMAANHCWAFGLTPALNSSVVTCVTRAMRQAAVVGIDAVVHLAAIVGDPACSRQPDLARAVNLQGSLALIEESQRAGVSRFLFASTCSNYGKMKDANKYVDEETELSPVSLYAETKVAVEKALLQSARDGRWCPTPLRFATIFGVSPRMRFDLTVNEFTMEMLTKKHLKVFGEQFWRPYVHVRDAARAIQLVLSSPTEQVAGGVFNVGATDQNFQKQQLVEMIHPYAPGCRRRVRAQDRRSAGLPRVVHSHHRPAWLQDHPHGRSGHRGSGASRA